jgi:hypothetical protein
MNGFYILLLVLGVILFTFLILAGFMTLLLVIFRQASGWNTLVKKYGTRSEPEGTKLQRQTVKIGVVRWRYSMTVVLSREGVYLKPGILQPIIPSVIDNSAVLVPWAELNSPRKGHIYLGWQATQLSAGNPEAASITFPEGLYKQISTFLKDNQ